MFSLFIGDLEMFLQENIECSSNIDDIVLKLVLFPDDMPIIANTPEDLQTRLDWLQTYCSNWGLEVTTTKTKVMLLFFVLYSKYVSLSSRTTYIKKILLSTSSVYNFVELFKSTNKSTVKSLSKYVYEAFNFRLTNTVDINV